MACGCGGKACSCQLTGGTGITITGSGSPADPYVIINNGSLPTPVNLPNIPLPADLGLLSWNAPLTDANHRNSLDGDDYLLVSGQVTLVSQYIHTPGLNTGVVVQFANSGIGLTSGQNFLGLYDSTGVQIARTADLTATWTSAATGGTKFPWTAAVTLPAGHYWVAFLSNATTQTPGFFTVEPPSYTSPNPYNFLTPANYPTAFNVGGRTTLPSSLVTSANFLSPYNYWSALY
jgi:hypothetical protein